MPLEMESVPNYSKHASSPKLADVGVMIQLAAGPHRLGKPLVLRGAYKIGDELAHAAGGASLTWVMIIVVRRDQPMGKIKLVQDGHNMALPEPGAQPARPVDPSARSGGYFNLDLIAFCKIITEPGRYWVMASLGDYVSERIEFEVLTAQ